jgi:3-oxoacyl-[acyl-carrier protein] reductase
MSIADKFMLKDRVAVITGGRRGIGKAIALAFAEAGADIAVCDQADVNNEFATLTDEVEHLGRKCLTIKTDVSKSNEVNEMVKKVLAAFGKIDVLVNNAGIALGGTITDEMKENEWDKVMDVNLKGTALCCHAVSKTMIERKSGSIINIASVEGLETVRRSSNVYGSSKAGIIMLTRGLAWDLGKYNVRANAIAPGGVKTDMIQGWDTSSPSFMQTMQNAKTAMPNISALVGDNPQMFKMMLQWLIPMGRIASPEEIATGALFLASDAASYVTGHTLLIDGGLLA